MLLETETCPQCGEKSDNFYECSHCDIRLCPTCEQNNRMYHCDMCSKLVCEECLVTDSDHICPICYDSLHITYQNYKSLTKAINEIIDDDNHCPYPELYPVTLGKILGQLNAIKAQFGF